MRRLTPILALSILCSATALAQRADWPTFHYDNARRGNSPAAFETCAFEEAWRFNLGEHTWRYSKGTSVWSASPVIADVDGRTMLFIGAYNHNLYGLDAATGEELWRLTTGGRLNAPPAFGVADGRPMVFIGSGDRSMYAADAATGQKLWQHETMPWSYTVGLSAPTAPLVTQLNGRTVVVVGFWNSDRRSLRTVQRSDIIVFDAKTGDLIWRRKVADTPITTPALLDVDGMPQIIVGAEDGRVFGLDLRSGDEQWSFTSGHAVTAAPMAATLGEQPAVFVGDRWGMVTCVSARSGAPIWEAKTGHEVKSTPALTHVDGRPKIYVGSSDRYLYCIDAKTSRTLWRYQTGKFVVSSPLVVDVAGKPAVIFSSLDNRLYVRDALSGQKIWDFETGDMLWPYETRGASLWSSPAVADVNGDPLLFFGSYDGNLYAFKAVPKCYAEETGADTQDGSRRSALLLYGPPALSLGLLLASFLILLGRREETRPED